MQTENDYDSARLVHGYLASLGERAVAKPRFFAFVSVVYTALRRGRRPFSFIIDPFNFRSVRSVVVGCRGVTARVSFDLLRFRLFTRPFSRTSV